jgi:hypothetical protein
MALTMEAAAHWKICIRQRIIKQISTTSGTRIPRALRFRRRNHMGSSPVVDRKGMHADQSHHSSCRYVTCSATGDEVAVGGQPSMPGKGSIAKFVSDQFLPLALLAGLTSGYAVVGPAPRNVIRKSYGTSDALCKLYSCLPK